MVGRFEEGWLEGLKGVVGRFEGRWLEGLKGVVGRFEGGGWKV